MKALSPLAAFVAMTVAACSSSSSSDTGNGSTCDFFELVVKVPTAPTSADYECLGEAIAVDATGAAECAMFDVLPAGSTCDAARGLGDVDANLATTVRASVEADATQVVCSLAQLNAAQLVDGSCTGSTAAGFCYVVAPHAGTCGQALLFSPTGAPHVGESVLVRCAHGC